MPARAPLALANAWCRDNHNPNRYCGFDQPASIHTPDVAGVQRLLMERMCLGPPHAARVIVLSCLDQVAHLDVRDQPTHLRLSHVLHIHSGP